MTYWYQKIADPDAVTTRAAAPVSDVRLRFITASRASGLFQDEPEVLQAFVNADVPFSVANRTMAEIARQKIKQGSNLMSQAGFSDLSLDTNQKQAKDAASLADKPNAQTTAGIQGNLLNQQNQAAKDTGFWDSIGSIGKGIVDAGKNAVGAIGEGLNKISSPIMVPLAAGSAQKNTDFEKFLDKTGKMDPGPLGAMTAVVGSAFDFGKGVASATGLTGIDQNQKTDMQKAGYDPNSAASRYAYYYQQFNGQRKPVSENVVEKLKNQFAPKSVDLARELVTSGYFDDPVRGINGLSPEAQAFARNLGTQGQDSADGKLVKAMQDNSSLSFGGHLADITQGSDLGGTKRAWQAGLSDLVAFWYIDPLVAVGGGVKAVKYGMRGIPANKIEEVTSMLAASDDALKPKGFNAKRFDDVLRTVDKIYNLNKADKMLEAAKETEKFQRLHPDMMGMFDTLSGMRSGAITRVRPREGVEQIREAGAAQKANRDQQPFLFDSAPIGKEKPVWKLTDSADEVASAEASAKARESLSNDLGLYVWYEAITSGRPLYQGKMLLPGQIAVNARARQGFAKVRDLYSRQDGKFTKMLASTDVARHKVDLDGDVLSNPLGHQEILTDTHAQDWVKKNYIGTIGSPTLGLSKAFGKSWRYFENSFSNKTMNFDSPESTELFRRWVVQFLPKRHAYALVNEFAQANPAARYGLFQQTVVASLNASGMRNTPAAKRQIDQMLKGIAPKNDVFGRVGAPLEMYTDPANNLIKIGDSDVASAVHSYQLSEGVQLPNLRELRRVLNRTSVLGYASGALNNATADAVTRAWKVMKVANPANMVRQALELYAFTAARSPEALGGAAAARYMLKADKGLQKADKNQLKRVAANLEKIVDEPTLARMDEAIRTGDTATYHGIILDALKSQGVKDRTADALARMGEGVVIRGMVPNGLSKSALAMAAPLDWLRRTRGIASERLGLHDSFNSPFAKELDDLAASQYLEGSLNNLGAAADNYVLMGENLGQSIRDQVGEGVALGFGFKTPRVSNAYEWADRPSTQQWASSIQAVQADELSNLVMRRAAMEYLGRENAIMNLAVAADAAGKAGSKFPKVTIPSTAGVAHSRRQFAAEEYAKRQAEIQKVLDDVKASPAAKAAAQDRLAKLADEITTYERYSQASLSTTKGFAEYLIGKDEIGQVVRDNAKRSNYTSTGRYATTPEDKFEAIGNHSKVLVDDVVRRLGGTVADDGRIDFPRELRPLIEKVADGKRVTANDLKGVKDEFKPEGVVAELFVPDLGKTKSIMRDRLNQMMGKAYSLTVSGPLASLAAHPVFLSHRRVAYDTMLPVFDELTKKGMSTQQAAYLLESAANRRALNLTFNATDNPGEHSVFSELTDNFLMFNRAQEDFTKRMFRATTASPALLARAKMLVDAAHHSGVVTVQKIQNDDGQEENQLIFTYPGSAAAVRVIADAWNSIGGEGDNLSMLPQYKGFSSQLRFINPSLSNPLQFSANPIIGMPLRLTRAMFPETSNAVNEWLTLVEGGERYFAEQELGDQFLPSAISRIIPIISKNEKDGQYASALRSALQYAEAAGVLPEPGKASPDELMAAQDTVRSMVQNILVQRAIFGVFAPAAPQLGEMGDMKTDAAAMAEGITNIKSEWFTVLEQQNQKYPDDGGRALSEAYVEWGRRYPKGSSIVNAKAFTVGSSKMTGSEETAPSTTEATQWMMDNLDWVKDNRAVAYYLLPTADGKWYEAAPYRLQFRQELREHKDLNEFYRDVALSDELSTFYDTSKAVKQAKYMNPGQADMLDAKYQAWIMDWKRMHPAAATELERKSDPNTVHEQIAPALGRAATGTNLPKELVPIQPQLKEMYADYQMYRDAYANTARNERGSLNKRYRDYGDRKWMGTPLEKLWNDLGRYESE